MAEGGPTQCQEACRAPEKEGQAFNEKKERIRKAKEAREAAAKEATENPQVRTYINIDIREELV